ncbi:MAG: thiamine pyrophosphate-dependent dehydrogenase E1 component subunit alpha [Candidatus Sulfotelmatobacter sp.]
MGISHQKLLWIYERMLLIRKFEDKVHELFAAGKLPGFVHLYAGEEAVAVGVCGNLHENDFITSTHRGHGHCIAKGVEVRGMMAELFGKATGVCKGKGGSMHIADVEKGMLGANGIVGGGLPLACGPALAAKVKETGQVAACFFSEGAANQGTFHEALNLAAVWKLPVLFICENNLYAEATPVEYSTSITNIADRASAYSMPGVLVDGMDVFAVYEATYEAAARARAGQGPTLIEAKTYRFYGHFEGDAIKYRTKEEEANSRARDPIPGFRQRVLAEKLVSLTELKEIDEKAEVNIADAVTFAEASPYPKPEECLTDVYVSY